MSCLDKGKKFTDLPLITSAPNNAVMLLNDGESVKQINIEDLKNYMQKEEAYISGEYDLNDFTERGLYYFKGDTNLTNIPPNGGGNGWLFVLNGHDYSITTAKQIYIRQGSNPNTFKWTYMRMTNNDGTWGDWFELSNPNGYIPITNNAGFHNSIYRGKNLGSIVTEEQWNAIDAGTFEDLFIGDYWVIGGINYRIAAFDYYYRTGDTECKKHHVTLVPDTNMYTHVMNDTNVVTGAYVGSKMYTEGLEQAKTTIKAAFGEAHILNHRQLLSNAVTGEQESGHAWYDSIVELMTEHNVYGGKIFKNAQQGTSFAYNHTIDKSQYPLFALNPYMISNRQWFWLRDVVNAGSFATVDSGGYANNNGASAASGVRPAFSICKS